MNIEDKALDIILDYTASSEWEDVRELNWTTAEVQELLAKALNQGQSLPIDNVIECVHPYKNCFKNPDGSFFCSKCEETIK